MTLKDAKRICKAHSPICNDCPFKLSEGHVCVLRNYLPEDWDIQMVKSSVDKWLKEHPEPIYPTYCDWLTGEGVYDFGERISEEFAEKYNIDPIE